MKKLAGIMIPLTGVFVPFVSIAIIVAFSDEPSVLMMFLLAPSLIAIPVLIWSIKKITHQVRSREPFMIKDWIFFGASLMLLDAGVCFYFMMSAGLSHGTIPRALFLMECLSATLVIAIVPLADTALYRFYKLSSAGSLKRIKILAGGTNFIFLIIMLTLLSQIFGSPLLFAMKKGNTTLAKIFLKLGGDVNRYHRFSASLLWYALHRADVEMTKLLLEKGAELKDNEKKIGLVRAVETGNRELLEFLLNKGADPDSTYMGATPLMRALTISRHRKDTEILELLLERGANINFRCEYPNMPYDRKTPLEVAYEQEKEEPQILELLLRYRGK